MGSSKTRLVVVDVLGGSPYGFAVTTEFDIYSEAIDYAATLVRRISADITSSPAQFYVYVFSYDRPSYSYVWNGSSLIRTEISYPLAQ